MTRLAILAIALAAPIWAQGDIRYFFNGKQRIQLAPAPPNAVHAWRIVGGARILQAVRGYEQTLGIFRALGTSRDALVIIRNRAVPAATAALFQLLERTGQAQPLRVFRLPGRSTPVIEYPEVYVKLKPGVNAAGLRQGLVNKKYAPGRAEDALHGWAYLGVKKPEETLLLADVLNHMPDLAEYAEPVFQWVLSGNEAPPVPPEPPGPGPRPPGAPNDTFFPRQWAMYQNFGIAIIPVWQAPSPTPGARIRVAVLDAPIDLTHPDLKPAVEVESQYNATSRNKEEQARLVYHTDPKLRSDHGTACAGIIAATRGNGFGVAGVASKVGIIPIQVLLQHPLSGVVFDSSTIAQGILHAVDVSADIISLSANLEVFEGLRSISDALDEIQKQPAKRIVFVNSTGNDPDGNIPGVAFPASEAARYPFLVPVGASDLCGALKVKATSPSGCDRETSWKSRSDDFVGTLLAPGLDIVTTTNVKVPNDPGDRRNYRKNFSGTSAAAPFVSGVVALMLSAQPGMTAAEVRKTLYDAADVIPGTKHRRLNACKALGVCAQTPGTD